MKNSKGKGAGVEAPAGPHRPGAQQIEQIPVADLIPYARNARTHSEEQVGQIAGSIQEFGFNVPVLIDGQNSIIAGHGRVLAAQRLKLDTVPCIRLTHLTDAQRRAYILADNRIALNSGWDEAMLQVELEELHADKVDLGLLGFEAGELEALLQLDLPEGANEITEDEVPEPPANPITKPGDLWLLGNHRLLCGDSTNADDVERLMAGVKADLCFTSPPYGQQRDYTKEGKEKCQDWDGLMRGVFGNLPMAEDGQVLVNLGMIHRDGEWLPYWDGWIAWMREQGWRRFGWYVWDKGFSARDEGGRLSTSHEFIWHFNRVSVDPEKWIPCQTAGQVDYVPAKFSDAAGQYRGKDNRHVRNSHRIAESVVRVNRGASRQADHPAAFPVALVDYFAKSWLGLMYEPFCGSGTTLIAAEQLGRKCYGMEISPAYCDVIVKRWETLTGKKASLEVP